MIELLNYVPVEGSIGDYLIKIGVVFLCIFLVFAGALVFVEKVKKIMEEE